MTDRQITRRLSSGVWVRERRNQFRLAGPDGGIADVVAAWRTTANGRAVVSHVSAARFWRLPTPLAGTAEVMLTAPAGRPKRRDGVHLRVAPLARADVHEPGILVTSPARTVIDCLRILPPRDGLAIVDAALHRGMTDRDALQGVADRQSGWRGIATARSVLAVADGRRESPLESWSAWGFAQIGLTPPTWQVDILTPGGRFIARVDAWWPEGVAGEADGRAKYALRAAAANRSVDPRRLQKVFEEEKRREARVRDVGVDVMPWHSEDVLDPTLLNTLGARINTRRVTALTHPCFIGIARPSTRR